MEQQTFTLLVFSATGRECSMFVKKLSRLIPIKRKEELSVVTYGIRVSHYYEVAYYVYEGVESQIMNMKNWIKYLSFNAITIVKRKNN